MTKEQLEQARKLLNETPGKADDFLETSACFLEELASTLRYAKDNFVEEDGTFQDIKLAEVDKWLPIVRYVLQRSQAIADKCFDTALVPDSSNEIVKLILSWLGLRMGN